MITLSNLSTFCVLQHFQRCLHFVPWLSLQHHVPSTQSLCACREDDLFSQCTNLQCNLPTITPSPTRTPTIAPTPSPSLSPTVSPTVSPTLTHSPTAPPLTIPFTNLSLWLHLFKGDTMELASSTTFCALETFGDEQHIAEIANTAGYCGQLTTSNVFTGMAPYNFYALDLDHESMAIDSVSLFCDSSCSECAYSMNSSDVILGECLRNITVRYDTYNVMMLPLNHSAIATTETVNNVTSTVLDYNGDLCIGGNANITDSDGVIWISYNATECNSRSVSLQNFGAFNVCHHQHSGRYALITPIAVTVDSPSTVNLTETALYSINTGCDSTCNVTRCSNSKVVSSSGLRRGECSSNSTADVSYKFVYSRDLKICGDEVTFDWSNGTTPAPVPSHDENTGSVSEGTTIGLIVGSVVLVLLVTALVVWKRRELAVWWRWV